MVKYLSKYRFRSVGGIASNGETPMTLLSRFLLDQSGATAIEYGLIAVATSLALSAVMPSLNSTLSGTYAQIESYFHNY
jgi:pilus assembly protein Flp/PilA